MTIGERLGDLRRQRGWTQADLADHAYVHATAVSRIEGHRREPKISMLLTLAKAFGITLSELLEGVDEHIVQRPEKKVSNS